jgi:hypothetical protein
VGERQVMSRCLKPYGRGHDPAARTLVAVMVLAACSVPVYPLTDEDAPDLPPGQVPYDGDDVPFAAARIGT